MCIRPEVACGFQTVTGRKHRAEVLDRRKLAGGQSAVGSRRLSTLCVFYSKSRGREFVDFWPAADHSDNNRPPDFEVGFGYKWKGACCIGFVSSGGAGPMTKNSVLDRSSFGFSPARPVLD